MNPLCLGQFGQIKAGKTGYKKTMPGWIVGINDRYLSFKDTDDMPYKFPYPDIDAFTPQRIHPATT